MNYEKKFLKYKNKLNKYFYQLGGDNIDCKICNFSYSNTQDNCPKCGYLGNVAPTFVSICKKCGFHDSDTSITECKICKNTNFEKANSNVLPLSEKGNFFLFTKINPGFYKVPPLYDYFSYSMSGDSIINIYTQKIKYIDNLFAKKTTKRIDDFITSKGLPKDYVEYFKNRFKKDESVRTEFKSKSYIDMIKNIKIPNTIDDPIVFIKEFTKQIFINISVYPYSLSNEINENVNRYFHGSLNHLRSLLFAIEITILMKKNTPDLFNKLFTDNETTGMKRKKFLIISILSSLFKSLLRIDETGTIQSGSYYVTQDILQYTFDDKNKVLQEFNYFPNNLEYEINFTNNKIEKRKDNYLFLKDNINTPVDGNVNLEKYYEFKDRNYKPTETETNYAIILFGNPGAGKSVIKKKLYSDILGLDEKNFIEIDPDEVRYYHPKYVEDINGTTVKNSELVNFSFINKNNQTSSVNKSKLKEKEWISPNGDKALRCNGYAIDNKFISIQNSVKRTISKVQDAIQEPGKILDKYIGEGKNLVYDTACTNITGKFCLTDIYQKFINAGYKVYWVGINTDKKVSIKRAEERQFVDGRWMKYENYLQTNSYTFDKFEDVFGPEKIKEFLNEESRTDTITNYITFSNTYDRPMLLTHQVIDMNKPEDDRIEIKFDFKNYTTYPPMVYASSILLFSILKSRQSLFELSDDDIARISYSSSYYPSGEGQKEKNKQIIEDINNWKDGNDELLDNIETNDFKMILADLYSNIGHYLDHCRNSGIDSKSIYSYRSNLFRKLVKTTVDDDVNTIYNIMSALKKTKSQDSNPNIFKEREYIKRNCVTATDLFPEGENAMKMVRKCCVNNEINNPDFYRFSTNFEDAWTVYEFDEKLDDLFR